LEREGSRRIRAWLLILWIEGYTVDVRPAVTRYFDKLLEAMADDEKVATAVEAISAKKVKGLRGGKQRLLKRNRRARFRGLDIWVSVQLLAMRTG
jgi:hypothetical protein